MKLIRKISAGPDPKNAMHYIVGNGVIRDRSGEFTHTVELIERVSSESFEIWIKNSKNEIYPWKTIERCPVIIEYNIDY